MVRFGIIGTNWITESFIEAARMMDEFKLTAIYSRTKEKGQTFGNKYGVNNIFTSIESMVHGDVVDAVYIASPNSLHAEQAILCMENRKHVLCEKPIASNGKEVEKMIHVAKNHDVVLMEALKTTLLPNFKVIKENIHKLGKVRKYIASYCQYSSRYDAYKEDRLLNAFNPAFSNGAIMDIGIYCIYPLVALFGEPREVKAAGLKLDSGVDGQGSVLLKYNEMDAVVNYSKITNSYLPSEIQGERGSMLIDKIHTPEEVKIIYIDGSEEILTVEQRPQSMFYEAEEFIQTIKGGRKESHINSLENTRVTIRVMEEIRSQIGVVFPADH
ncbi:Gfo/Idh/MocA family oxidoreductase [Evansella sp. AB-P1]|uniref:Gfo/Idh/MocA family protein n=1 Tax=Evansella sp. AB-P1 TaxID=3037653 RepID=UPI00241E6DF7|nr:Gfo/Idh/MocA family oxidoreductase [Evansella sp. AB-P1]MDG5787467.1 Gfo/Idh/MocA family oxidoreductase [Evansella sp. AB-P1]